LLVLLGIGLWMVDYFGICVCGDCDVLLVIDFVVCRVVEWLGYDGLLVVVCELGCWWVFYCSFAMVYFWVEYLLF